jgi:hypothetical protein
LSPGIFEISWTLFKQIAITKQLGMQYIEETSQYVIVINEGVLVWQTTVAKDEGQDVVEFETTYKPLSNRPSFFLGQFRNKHKNITGNTTCTVKSGNGVLRALSINENNTGGAITLWDSTSASGTKIATFQIGTPAGALGAGQSGPLLLQLTVEFTTGLTIVTTGSGSNDITAYYT